MDTDKSPENQSSVVATGATTLPSSSAPAPPPAASQESKSPNSSAGEVENTGSHEADPLTEAASAPTESDALKRPAADGLATEPKRYRLKRRKIKAAGAPKMPLTGW